MAATYTDNGTNTPNDSHLEFSYSFPVLKTEDVKVALNGVTQATTKYAVDNTSNPTKITFNNTNVDSTVQESTGAPKTGVIVRVYRETTVGKTNGDEDPKAVFAAGSSIRAADLNNNQEQALFGIHELQEKIIQTEDIADDAITSAKLDTNIDIAGTLASGATTVTGNISVSGTVDGRDVAADGSKLDGIDTGAKDDQTAAEIRTLVESASDSNVFTDADHSKLNAIEASATADQTGAEIKTAYEAESNTNAYTDAEKTKLSGIATGAEVNVQSDWNASSGDAQILNKPSAALTTGATFTGDVVVNAANKEFKIQNGSGVDKFVIDTDNGNLTTSGNITASGTTILSGSTIFSGSAQFLGDADTDQVSILAKLSADLIPYDTSIDLGSSSSRFSGFYGTTVDVTGDISVTGDIKVGTAAGTANQYLKKNSSNELAWETVSPGAAGGANTIHMNDDVKITFGDTGTPDLEIFHNADGNSYIKNNNGDLVLRDDVIKLKAVSTTDTYLEATNGGGVSLRWDNVEHFATTESGAKVTGELEVTGNAGVGGDITKTWNLGKALHIGVAENALWGEADYAFHMTQNAYYNSGWKYTHTDEATLYSQEDGKHRFKVASSGDADAAITWTTALDIDNSSNATFAGDVIVGPTDGEVTAGGFYFTNNIGSPMSSDGIRRSTTATMSFDVDSAEKMTLTSSGLSVAGSVQSNGNLVIDNTTDADCVLRFYDAGSDSWMIRQTNNDNAIAFRRNSSDKFKLDSSGDATFTGDISIAGGVKTDFRGDPDADLSSIPHARNTGNTSSSWWKIGQLTGVGSEAFTIKILGCQGYSSGGDVAAENIIVGRFAGGSEEIQGYFYKTTQGDNGVEAVAWKYTGANNIFDLWIKGGSYQNIAPFVDASCPNFTADVTDTGSATQPTGSTLFDTTFRLTADTGVQLGYDNVTKLQTTSDGAKVTGTLQTVGNEQIRGGYSLELYNGFDNRNARIQNTGDTGNANLNFKVNNAGTESTSLTLSHDGNATFSGDVIVGTTGDSSSASLNITKITTEVLADDEPLYDNPSPAFLTIYNPDNTGSGEEAGINIVPAGNNNGAISIYGKKTASYAGDLIFRFRTGASTSAERLRISSDGKATFAGTVNIPTVPGTNNSADQAVLSQTATGDIDGGSGLTYNPANDQLKVNGLTITSQQVLGATTSLKLACANNSSTTHLTITDKVAVTGTVTQPKTDISASEIDCSTGNYFYKAISTGEALVLTFTGLPSSGEAYGMIVELKFSGDASQTTVQWPTSVTWADGGSAPTFTEDKTQVYSLITHDGGTKWRASHLKDYTN